MGSGEKANFLQKSGNRFVWKGQKIPSFIVFVFRTLLSSLSLFLRSLYSSRVLENRFEFSAVSPPLLQLFITTVSEAVNLFHSVSSSSSSPFHPPCLISLSLSLFSSFLQLAGSFFVSERSVLQRLSGAFLSSCISRFVAVVWLLGRLVTWLLGYRGAKGKRTRRGRLRSPGASTDIRETFQLRRSSAVFYLLLLLPLFRRVTIKETLVNPFGPVFRFTTGARRSFNPHGGLEREQTRTNNHFRRYLLSLRG